MRESFIFYRSFFEAICKLDDKKRLKMYDLITNFALNEEEIDSKFEICEQLFILIKPQIIANFIKNEQYFKDVENGKKGAEYGKRGGRPKKIMMIKKTPGGFSKNNPPKNPINENVNENENENVNTNIEGVFFNNKKIDPFLSKKLEKYFEIYEKNCIDLSHLTFERRNREIRELLADFISETDNDIEYFISLCNRANDLKQICDRQIDFKMLLKNHIGIFNGKYNNNDTFSIEDYLRNGTG